MSIKIAIIGHASDKFNQITRRSAHSIIAGILEDYRPCILISGGCPMGGIDIWAEEMADKKGIEKIIYRPKYTQWDPDVNTYGKDAYGFKARNLDIARNCDVLYNIVVRTWPENYRGTKYNDYHCAGKNMDKHPHVKSGGCWTLWEAYKQGKEVHFIIIDGEDVSI